MQPGTDASLEDARDILERQAPLSSSCLTCHVGLSPAGDLGQHKAEV